MAKVKKDPDSIAALEKAIAKKYGKETVLHPKSNWSDEKEKEYIEQLKIIESRLDELSEKLEKIEVNGVFVSKKLFNKERINRTCPTCKAYSFSKQDDLYMAKYDCCFRCYIKHIDGRKQDAN